MQALSALSAWLSASLCCCICYVWVFDSACLVCSFCLQLSWNVCLMLTFQDHWHVQLVRFRASGWEVCISVLIGLTGLMRRTRFSCSASFQPLFSGRGTQRLCVCVSVHAVLKSKSRYNPFTKHGWGWGWGVNTLVTVHVVLLVLKGSGDPSLT